MRPKIDHEGVKSTLYYDLKLVNQSLRILKPQEL